LKHCGCNPPLIAGYIDLVSLYYLSPSNWPVTNTFLLQPGRWKSTGVWQEGNNPSLNVTGKTVVAWSADNWFTMITKLSVDDRPDQDTTWQYRGYLEPGSNRYTFILTHSQMGKIEGEGWIGSESIVQRYWVLDDQHKRVGFEAFHQIDDDNYRLAHSSAGMNRLASLMELQFSRQL
jgi:hypothetical protein